MSISKATAGIFGAVYLLVGIVGFIPALGGSDGTAAHNLLGLFPVNAVHNVVHMAVGLLGLLAYSRGASASRLFARGIGAIYLVLAVAGAIFNTGNFLGIVPIGGLDIALHAASALVLLVVGFAPEAPASRIAGNTA
jgi:hypothetical protein